MANHENRTEHTLRKSLPCGARVWTETQSEVSIDV